MKKPIQDLNIGYELLHPTSIIATHCHYQRTVIRGRENLPKDGAYIIAPCHQNALMEPMAMLAVLPSRIVFLARADIFQKPAARAFLTFLKILPVYRIRDGKSSLAKNEEIFAKSKQVLLSRVPLCMMAEGRHNDRHQLLPLVKGMFRIAGETQRELGDTPLYIVPTGIDFDHYEHPYSNLVINIGKPIPVQPFMEQFEADEPVALNQMRERLAVALKQQMHHVESKENYEEVYALCHILNRSWRKRKHRCNTAWNRFITRCEIAQHFNKSTNQPSTPPTTQQLNNSTTQQLNNSTFNPSNNSTTQQLNNSTTQPSTLPTTQQLNNSTTQPSTPPTNQQLNNSTTQQLNPQPLQLSRTYLDICQRLHLDLHAATDPWHPLWTLTATAAVAAAVTATALFQPVREALLWILLCNPLILIPTHLLVKKLIKDPQFRSSVNYGIRLVLSLLYTIVITVVMCCTRGIGWGALALATAVAVARANAIIHPFLRRWLQNLQRGWLHLTHRSDMRQLRQLEKALIDDSVKNDR